MVICIYGLEGWATTYMINELNGNVFLLVFGWAGGFAEIA